MTTMAVPVDCQHTRNGCRSGLREDEPDHLHECHLPAGHERDYPHLCAWCDYEWEGA